MRSLTILLLASAAIAQQQAVSSPDCQIQFTFSLANGGQLAYDVTYRGKPVITRSNLGIDVQNQIAFGANFEIVKATPSRIDETYTVPAGKSNPVRNACKASIWGAGRVRLEGKAVKSCTMFAVQPDRPPVVATSFPACSAFRPAQEGLEGCSRRC